MEDDYGDYFDDFDYDCHSEKSINRLYSRISELQREIGTLYDKVYMYSEYEMVESGYNHAYIQEQYYLDYIKSLELQLKIERNARFTNPKYCTTDTGEHWYIPEPEDYEIAQHIIPPQTIIDNIIITHDL